MTALGDFSAGDVLTAADLNAIGTWTSWTPTVTASTGTITTGSLNYALYAHVNQFVIVRFAYTITTAGTAAGSTLLLTPPSGLPSAGTNGDGIGIGRENAVTGNALLVLQSGSNFRIDSDTGGGWIQNNRGVSATFIYQVS